MKESVSEGQFTTCARLSVTLESKSMKEVALNFDVSLIFSPF